MTTDAGSVTASRSLLFVPGNRPDMLRKAASAGADVIMPDMEDSVPAGQKVAARSAIRAALPELARSVPVIPRINSLGTGHLEDDLAAVAGPHIIAVSVGKVRGPEDVRELVFAIAHAESDAGLAVGRLAILLWLESAGAVARALEVCTASQRIRWAAFGSEDFSLDMGIPSPDVADRGEVGHRVGARRQPIVEQARATVAIAARAAGVIALDPPYMAFRDAPGLARDAARARMLGYQGKCAIHPAQIGAINAAFTPAIEEIEHARAVIAAWEIALAQDRGATSLDGQLVDVPVVERARLVLRAAGQGD